MKIQKMQREMQGNLIQREKFLRRKKKRLRGIQMKSMRLRCGRRDGDRAQTRRRSKTQRKNLLKKNT